MKNIRFQGREYLFTGDSLEEGGSITTAEAFSEGTCSYAHLMRDGTVMRFGDSIGHRDEIEVLGDAKEPDVDLVSLVNMLTHPSWEKR